MANRSDPPTGGPPANVFELVGGGGAGGDSDPDAAREALGNAGQDQAGQADPGAGQAARDRRPGARGDRRGRKGGHKGGHKPTKAELEAEVRELRAAREAAAPEAVELVQDTAQQIAPAIGALFQTSFGMLARQRGAHWILKSEEKEILAQHWAIALAPYMEHAGPYVPWAAAVMVTWGVVESRVNQDSSALVLPAA